MDAPTRGRGKRAGLTREAILNEARVMTDGGEARRFSMRSLGARLGVDPMAIHYHFGGREQLLDALADELMLEVLGTESESWEERLREIGSSLRTTVVAFRGIEWAVRDFQGCAGEVQIVSHVHNALLSTGLPQRDAAAAARALIALAIGSNSSAQRRTEGGETQFRQGTALLIDGLRMRTLERKVASGEE